MKHNNHIPKFGNRILLMLLSLVLLIAATHSTKAQKQKETRILFLMDASSSMSLPWYEKTTRFEAASRIVLSIIDSMYAVNNEVEFAVRTYGTEYTAAEKNCFDTRLEVPFSMQNVSQIKQKLKYIRPIGSSPIAYSLQEASRNELSNTQNYEYSFILLTDGGESCNGNICDMYKKLVENKVKVLPYIIGLDTNKQLLSYYNCLGKYVNVKDPGDIANAVKMIVNDNKILLDKPKTKNIKTVFSESAPLAKPNPIVEEPIVYKAIDLLNVKSILAKIADYKRPIFKTITPSKTILPNMSFEPPYNPVAVQAINSYTIKQIISSPLAKPIIDKLQLPKTILPNISFEPPYNPAAVQGIANYTIKPMASAPLAKPVINKLLLPKTTLPNIAFEPPYNPIAVQAIQTLTFKGFPVINKQKPSIQKWKLLAANTNVTIVPEIIEKPLEPIFPAQFRISFPPKSSDSVRPFRFRKRALIDGTGLLPSINKLLSKGKPSTTTKPTTKETNSEFSVETTNSELTQIAVYFTDGNGKFYPSKPMVAIMEPGTNNIKQKFMRDVYKNQQPEPVDLKVTGVFDISILGQKDVIVRNVQLEKNKLNKVIIKVSQGTLQFAYRSNRTIPVKYEARITKRWIQNPEYTFMACDEVKIYDPGEYYVEINTLPPKRLHTEISFGAVTEIQIAQDGQVQFEADKNIGMVTLYHQDGNDKYADFLDVTINQGTSKPLYLQPGLYKAEFQDPSKPKFSEPIILNFKVESLKSTNIPLASNNGLLITPNSTGTMKIIDAPVKIKLK